MEEEAEKLKAIQVWMSMDQAAQTNTKQCRWEFVRESNPVCDRQKCKRRRA
jgi:hypothetical protein